LTWDNQEMGLTLLGSGLHAVNQPKTAQLLFKKTGGLPPISLFVFFTISLWLFLNLQTQQFLLGEVYL
jgi:hypothetical protein